MIDATHKEQNAALEAEDDFDMLKLMKNTKGKDWQPLTEDNWEQEMQQVPLFMNKMPSPEDVENNPALQALQSLVYDGTEEETAENFKAQGDEIFKQKDTKKYHDAVQFYTKALCVGVKDVMFECKVLLNRAAVHLEMLNYRSALNDCVRVVKKSSQIDDALRLKALYRCAKACIGCGKIEEAQECIEMGVKAGEQGFDVLQKLLNDKKQAIKKEEERQQNIADSKTKRADGIIDFVKKHGLSFSMNCDAKETTLYKSMLEPWNAAKFVPNSCLYSALFPLPQELYGDFPEVSTGGELSWPCLLIYPQLNTFDYIKAWSMSTKFRDQLETVLDDRKDLTSDDGFQYTPANVSVYFPSLSPKDKKFTWSRTNVIFTLERTMRLNTFELPQDGVLRFWVVPSLESSGSAYTKTFLKSFNVTTGK